MEIIIIAAMAENRVIGKDNAIPWSVKEDMAHFRELTMGSPCIMGRKTWESLPKKPLPGRLNIIISKSMTDNIPENNVKVFQSFSSAVDYCRDHEKIFICGGASVYREALVLADKMEITLIHGNYKGDVYFPEIDPALWEKTAAADFDGFSFISYSKKS